MKFILAPFFLAISLLGFSQFTQQDSIRGEYGMTRNWWDVTRYDLSVDFNIEKQEISGKNIISYALISRQEIPVIQIDLQDPMIIDSVFMNEKPVDRNLIKKVGNAYFIKNADEAGKLAIYFHGSPRIAKKAPWDGGIIWTKDKNDNPWVTIACQGLGASCWYPCKDSQYDEPDSASMHFTCPSGLVCVSNGVFTGKTITKNKATYNWEVVNPINNYCIIPYIGKYVNIHEHFAGEAGTLEVDYWVIEGNEEKAKKQFADVPRTLKAFEYWFGPYPFYQDGYKLVEAPHLGMEHQSAVAYGNKFQNGYLGTDLSGTGEGLKWDFIIVHESGHEWFGNNITSKDIADMWIHESFTNYSETLFMDYWFGTEAGNKYVLGLRKNIENDIPIIGPYGVNKEGSGDMYYKGANMLHTIRQLVDNDSLFRECLRGLNQTFWHQTVTTQEVEDYMSKKLNIDLSKVFDQYLRTVQIPTLEMVYSGTKIKYRWTNCVKGFDMPVPLGETTLLPTQKWKKLDISDYKHPMPNEQLYINYTIQLAPDFKKNAGSHGLDLSRLKSIKQPHSK